MCYIPFTTYLAYSAIVLIVYYLVIAVLFHRYRKQFIAELRDIKKESIDVDEEDGVLFDMASSIHALMAQASAQKSSKSETLDFVRQLLQKYQNTFSDTYCEKLQPVIVTAFERKLHVSLSEAEINSLWPAFSP
jgi:hypothetical protein